MHQTYKPKKHTCIYSLKHRAWKLFLTHILQGYKNTHNSQTHMGIILTIQTLPLMPHAQWCPQTRLKYPHILKNIQRHTVSQASPFMPACQIISSCVAAACVDLYLSSLTAHWPLYVFRMSFCFFWLFYPQFLPSICLLSAVCGWRNGGCFSFF